MESYFSDMMCNMSNWVFTKAPYSHGLINAQRVKMAVMSQRGATFSFWKK
jgi:hypothetical protein